MDAGYQPSYSLSQENNGVSGHNHFPHYLLDQTGPSAMQLSDLRSSSEFPHFPFDPHHPESHSFTSTPLIDYAIFDTPVDISLGALPPRSTSSRALAQGRIPRPRNAFMLFRSAFHREKRLAKTVEKDHRHISRIIGLCWAELSEAEKDVWRQKAELEKQQHALAYPEYRFKPIPRTKQPVKRNVKRNSPKEIERCHKIARLLRDGKSGEELTHAVKHLEGDQPSTGEGTVLGGREERLPKKQRTLDYTLPPVHERQQEPHFISGPSVGYYGATDEPPPFRSPLLPPSDFPQIPSKCPFPAAPLESTTTPPAQPTTVAEPLKPSHNFYLAQTHPTQDYIPREIDRSSKLRQHPQDGQQPTFDWPTKVFVVTPYDQADPKQQYPEPSHNFHYASLDAKGSFHATYTSGGHFSPGVVDWSSYYREDAARAFAEPGVTASSVYESWSNSNSNTNTSASPVQSDSPIKAL